MADLFWTDAKLEPKRGYRFIVTLGNMPGGATYYIKSVQKPGLEITAKEHMYLGHRFHYPGLVKWTPNPIEIKLVDPVNPDASQNLSAIIQASGYVIPKDAKHVTTMSKGAAVGALGTVAKTAEFLRFCLCPLQGRQVSTPWRCWNRCRGTGSPL